MVEVRRTLRVRPIAGMWTADPAGDIPEGASPDMQNFQVWDGYIRKRPGYGRYQTGSTFPASPITGVFSAQQQSGTRTLYATNRVGLYAYNIGTTNWDAQAGPVLTGSATDFFSFEISQNCLVFCQGVDNIQSLPLAGAVYAVINANAKPSKYLSRWNLRLYAGFTIEAGTKDSFRVRWPVSGDHTDWIGIGAGFEDLTDDVYQVRNIRKLIDVLCVYTEKGVFIGTKTGSATGPAQFTLQVKDVGLFIPRSLQGINTLHFLVGTDNLYTFNGTVFSPFADGVRTTIFSELNASSFESGFGLILYDSQEYVAFIPTANNTACDSAWVYSWKRNAVYPWRFAITEFTCGCLHYLDSSVTIASLSGTIASQTWVIGANTLLANYPIAILGGNDGHVHALVAGVLSDDGSAIACKWTSKDYTSADVDPSLAQYMVTINNVGFTYVDPGSAFTLQFSFSIDKGVSWIGPFAVTVGGGAVGSVGDGVVAHQVTGKRVRFKIENNTTNEFPQVQEFQPELEVRKQKKS